MKENNKIILFESSDGEVSLRTQINSETVWLSLDQMAELFQRDKSTVSRHVKNIFDEGECIKNSVVANFATTAQDGKVYDVDYYNLDVIISVGYRVKSQRGVEFRKWATSVLKDYILKGYAENKRRLHQLNQMMSIMERAPEGLESGEIIQVVKSYTKALDLLDNYDHQSLNKPKGTNAIYILKYDECKDLISKMKFAKDSDLFGVEKDDSFKSSISAIYQGFGGQDIYPSMEEKAANLLYFVVKNHSFHDGNKRIAATLFLHFLNKNNALFIVGKKRISDNTLVALTIMIAESKPEEKEAMVTLVMSFLEAEE